ncbi:nostrin isoform X1 [Ornithorhynchus anatinus]|uniref:nostrin isoform X1 n=2 Tax=Ornithorhynchus anatinus TaxID=9258 RepID=UPI0010A7D341|nr:nostrin isoform X1 [Ornithorhynchus anatinus]
MKNPLTDGLNNKLYQDLKEFSQNGENICKQLTSILQQRANLEISYAKGLEKLASKLTKAVQSTKTSCIWNAWARASEGMKSAADLHQKLGKAILLEAIKPTHQSLSVYKKKKRTLDDEVERTANLVTANWNQQIKAKKKLMVCTKKHEALFHSLESSKQSVTEKEKQKLLKKLKKSTQKMAKEDEDYYQKNMAGYKTRLRWEVTLEDCYQSILDLEKERIQMLCSILNQYNQHISSFGQMLASCHTPIYTAISKTDVDKDIQALMEEMEALPAEAKSEFLLTDYFEEDPKNGMDKERRKCSIKAKVDRLQEDIKRASQEQEGLEQMRNTYAENPSFSDAKKLKDTAIQLDETKLKLALLQANLYKLLGVLADLEHSPRPTHLSSSCISKWKEKEQTHSLVKISRPFRIKRMECLANRAAPAKPSSNQGASSGVSNLTSGVCKALYTFQARSDDELNLERGNLVTIHQKDDEGWWFGSLNGKMGYFPSAYVEEVPLPSSDTTSQA